MNQQLLEQLRAKDPETYRQAAGWLAATLGGSPDDNNFLDRGPYPLRDALLQAVLQEAISSRGWDWTVFRQQKRSIGGEYAAITGPHGRACASGGSPTEALLAAYIEAIGR